MFEELGISFGTALIVLLALYFIIKWAVKNGIKEAYRDITGKVTAEDIEAEQICNELGLNEEEKQLIKRGAYAMPGILVVEDDENAMCKAYGKRMMFMSIPFIAGMIEAMSCLFSSPIQKRKYLYIQDLR